MNRSPWVVLSALALIGPAAAAPPKPLVAGLKNPESVCVGPDGRIYVTVIGEFDKDGDGAVVVIDGRQGRRRSPPASTTPRGSSPSRKWLFVADKTRVAAHRPRRARSTVFAAAKAFPAPPLFLNDIAVDPESGTLYVSDSGDLKGERRGRLPRSIAEGARSTARRRRRRRSPASTRPTACCMDGAVAPAARRLRHRRAVPRQARRRHASRSSPTASTAATAWPGTTTAGCTSASWKGGKVCVIPRPGEKPVLLAEGFQSAADICLDRRPASRILVPDMKAGTLTADPRPGPRGRGR